MSNPLNLPAALDLAALPTEEARVSTARMLISSGVTRPEYQCVPGDVDRSVASVRRAFDLAYRDADTAAAVDAAEAIDAGNAAAYRDGAK